MNLEPVVLEKFEIVKCSLCNSPEYQVVLRGPDRCYLSDGEFQVVKCSSCGLIYTNPRPRPEALSSFYPKRYGPHNKSTQVGLTTPPSSIEILKVRIRQGVADIFYYKRPASLLKKLALLPFAIWFQLLHVTLLPSPKQPQDRLLDMGCGTGTYLATLRSYWQELYGVEVDEEAAQQAKYLEGLKIHTGDLLSAKFPSNFFDVVVMWHVLEHIANQAEVLLEINRILKPDGYLIIMVPNIASFEFKLFGINWKGLDLPRHLYHFSPTSLKGVLSQTGFKTSRITTQIEPVILEASIRNVFNLERPKAGTGIWKIIRLLLFGFSFLLSQLNTSGIIVAYAQPYKNFDA
ncbi:MAG TPA: class I SAM-dependent methyltransferase [Chloroflexia bacterium]|nr:class I SAM-dependent methyltransferase [Chloroflexia bacterium]